MAKASFNDEEPKRIARPGLGGGQQPQGLHRPGGPGAHSSKDRAPVPGGSAGFQRYPRPQRVVVKTHIVRHHSPQKGRESITRHVRYLGREAVTRQPESGRFYDAKRDELDAKAEPRAWADDRHHFRLILSPENAHSLDDLKAYTREVMSHVEHDLGGLQWLAVNHTNTEHPHTHLLIRGRAQDGADLVISRQYISHGIRERAAEVATRWLGERTREEAQLALEREVRAERWTSLDGALARFAKTGPEGLHIDLKQVKVSRYALITRDLLAGRLQFLKEAGLARPVPPAKRTFLGRAPVWRLVSDYQKQLNELGVRHDVIKTLYASLGDAAAAIAPQVQRAKLESDSATQTPGILRGLVIAKGAPNELSDERFVVLEDRAGKPHYVRLWANETLDAAPVGGVLEVGRSGHRRAQIAREIIRVAAHAGDGLYSTGRHRNWLQAQQPRLAGAHLEERLRAFSQRVVSLSKQTDSGITHAAENAVAVDRAKLEQFISAGSRWPDVRVVVAHPLNEQVQVHAYTWLDRQIQRMQLTREPTAGDLVHNPRIQDAIVQRGNWLVEQGYARRGGDKPGAITFSPGAVPRLIAREHEEFAQACHQRFAKGVEYLREGQAVAGVYRGTAFRHRGTFAMIETDHALVAAPVSRTPWAERGQKVIAKAVTPKFARIELDRGGGPLKKLGVER